MIETAAGSLALVAAFAAAAAAIVRANRREAAARRDVLADCAGLLDEPAASLSPSGYGVLRGKRRGRAAALTPIAEALSFRRLPQLWLSAAVRAEAGGCGTIEIVRRPTVSAFFVGGSSKALAFAPPPSWPQDTSVLGDRDAGPALALLEPVLASALADPKVKAVMVTKRGVRVVRQAAQGERGAYLLFRDSRFPISRIAPDDAQAALDLASDLADLLASHDRIAARAA